MGFPIITGSDQLKSTMLLVDQIFLATRDF
jgi:hypothetical protein